MANTESVLKMDDSDPTANFVQEADGSCWGPIRDFDFGTALSYLRQDKRVCRVGWNGKGMWLGLIKKWEQYSVPYNSMWPGHELTPFIVMKTADNKLVPWLASQTDILAEDWMVLLETKTPV